MTAILLPPKVAYEAMLSHRGGYALLLKQRTDSQLDIKTIRKLQTGKASESKAEQFVEHLHKAHSGLSDFMTSLDAEIRQRYPDDSQQAQLAYVEQCLSWQPFISGFDAALKKSEPERNSSTSLHRHLLPLDQASIEARVAMLRDDLPAAVAIMKSSAIAPFISGEVWRRLSECMDVQSLVTHSAPIRLVGLLFVLAVLERDLAPDLDESRLGYCLPLSDTGVLSHPFARCLDRMQELCSIATIDEAVSVFLLDRDNPKFDSERKKYNRWRRGTLPELEYFRGMMQRFAIRQDVGQIEKKQVEDIYYGLHCLHELSKFPLTRYFESKKAFFDLYPPIFEAVG